MHSKSTKTRTLSLICVLGVIAILFGLQLVNHLYLVSYKIIYEQRNDQHAAFTIGVAGLMLWSLAALSYTSCVVTRPGFVMQDWLENQIEYPLPVVESRRAWQPKTVTFCEKCKAKRPERAHHCNVCEKCVLKMDHHCPWIGNCVGHGNSRCFLQFGLTLSVVSSLLIGTQLPFIVPSFGERSKMDSQKGFLFIFYFFNFMMLLCYTILGVVLFASFWSIVSYNRTTIESYYQGNNPYDLGWKKNIVQVFGTFGPQYFIPWCCIKLPCDGHSYPLNEYAAEVEIQAGNVVVSQRSSASSLRSVSSKHPSGYDVGWNNDEDSAIIESAALRIV